MFGGGDRRIMDPIRDIPLAVQASYQSGMKTAFTKLGLKVGPGLREFFKNVEAGKQQ